MLPLDTLIYIQAQADPLVVCPTAPVPARSILGMCSWTMGAALRNSLCKKGSGCRGSERPTGRHRARESPPGDGWGSQVKQETVWVDMSLDQGWAEPQDARQSWARQEFILQSNSKTLQTIKMRARIQKITINTYSGKINLLNLVCVICITTKSLFWWFF